jgi:hypothetical protein
MPMMPVLTHDKGESSKVHQRQTHASRNVYAVNNSKICKKMMRPCDRPKYRGVLVIKGGRCWFL